MHKRTFLGPLQNLPPVLPSAKGPNPPHQRLHDPALILAFLAQTAPFHPELVAQTDNAYETAEFYATAAKRYLTFDFSAHGEAAMQRVQAFLMLGYHDWAACRSRNGYVLIQTGVTFARINGFMYDEDFEKGHDKEDAAARRDRFIQQESRRRTFWTCVILDRYLSVGKRRPKVLQVKDFYGKIQIPCSEKNFISGRAVKTRYFGESEQDFEERRQRTNDFIAQRGGPRIEWEDREEDGMLGRYIFTLELFTDVNQWANNDGRRYVTD